MGKERLAAFSDGVLAIIITIMVLELRAPHGSGLAALRPLVPALLGYALSFVYIGIYWNNHHHLLAVTERVNGGVLWANMHLLFWLSLVPFATVWVGENRAAPVPTAAYGALLPAASLAYWVLLRTILAAQGPESRLAAAVGGGPEGEAVARLLYACDRAGVRAALDGGRAVCAGGPAVAGAGPAHRAGGVGGGGEEGGVKTSE